MQKVGGRAAAFFLSLCISLVCVGHFTKLFAPYLSGPLVSAAGHNRLALMRLLLFIGADANEMFVAQNYGAMPLTTAAYAGDDAAVALLLDNGANPNDESNSLRAAASAGHASTVELLLLRGAKVIIRAENLTKCDFALIDAASAGYTDVVALLLQKGAGNNDCINLALFDSAFHNKVETVQCLLSNGADVNYVNKNYSYGFTPLDVALDRNDSYGDSHELVEIFKQAGAKETDVAKYFRSTRSK